MKGVSATSAILAWVLLAVLVVAYVAVYDLWASATGHRTMSNQFGHWLTETIAGPIVLGLWGGLFIGLTMHFIMEAVRRR